jgi:hypothetical protein
MIRENKANIAGIMQLARIVSIVNSSGGASDSPSKTVTLLSLKYSQWIAST